MELKEISDKIDIRLNSFEKKIFVDEYEKSIYLTRAQNAMYKEMCNVFEETEIIDTYMHPFLKEFVTEPVIEKVNKIGLLNNTINIVVPSDIYMVVWEKALLSSSDLKYNNKEVRVVKTRIAEVPYKVENPFRKPDQHEILRVITGNRDTRYLYELLLPENTGLLQYSCKYLKDIRPIILEELPDGLVIEGETGPLNTEFIDEVLEKLIDIAVMSILQDKTAVQQQQNV
jgi:hypothetical protein